jgi:hypothetical protein
MHKIREGLGRNKLQQRIIKDNSYLISFLCLTAGKAYTCALSSFFLLLNLLPKNWGQSVLGRLVQGQHETTFWSELLRNLTASCPTTPGQLKLFVQFTDRILNSQLFLNLIWSNF